MRLCDSRAHILTKSLKDKFVSLVQMVSEQKEQVTYKCWAGWASEDKMRDELKLKEYLGLDRSALRT